MPGDVDYRPPDDGPRPSTAVALLLCSPGAACWLLVGPDLLPFRVLQTLRPLLSLLQIVAWPAARAPFAFWAAAVVTAIVSVARYLGSPSRATWAVAVNLTINIAGLLFTLLMLLGSGLHR